MGCHVFEPLGNFVLNNVHRGQGLGEVVSRTSGCPSLELRHVLHGALQIGVPSEMAEVQDELESMVSAKALCKAIPVSAATRHPGLNTAIRDQAQHRFLVAEWFYLNPEVHLEEECLSV